MACELWRLDFMRSFLCQKDQSVSPWPHGICYYRPHHCIGGGLSKNRPWPPVFHVKGLLTPILWKLVRQNTGDNLHVSFQYLLKLPGGTQSIEQIRKKRTPEEMATTYKRAPIMLWIYWNKLLLRTTRNFHIIFSIAILLLWGFPKLVLSVKPVR